MEHPTGFSHDLHDAVARDQREAAITGGKAHRVDGLVG
jgi:hypothetical protein